VLQRQQQDTDLKERQERQELSERILAVEMVGTSAGCWFEEFEHPEKVEKFTSVLTII
jgi:hypothetical protein